MEQPMNGTEAQRFETDSLDALAFEKPRAPRLGRPVREEEPQRLCPQATPREGQDGHRRRIQPLHVIDCQQHRFGRAELPDHAAKRNGDSTLIRRRTARACQQHRNS